MEIPDIRLQSSLGTMDKQARIDKGGMQGYITLAKVLKVHHKHHTADVQIIRSKDSVLSSEEQEGRHSAIITEQHAGYISANEVYYGNYTAIEEDALVLICFAENYKSQPFILCSVHEFEDVKNPFPLDYPLESWDEERVYEHFKITRNQDFFYMDGRSNFDIAHKSKAFVSAGTGDKSDEADGFSYEDLEAKSKITGETLCLPYDEINYTPLDILICLPDKYDELEAGFLKLWISAKTGAFRTSKFTNSKPLLSYFELQENGSFVLRRQVDSERFGAGNNYAELTISSDAGLTIRRYADGSNYAEIEISEDTTMTMRKSANGQVSTIKFLNDGSIEVDTRERLNVHADKDINITSDTVINIIAPSVNISGMG